MKITIEHDSTFEPEPDVVIIDIADGTVEPPDPVDVFDSLAPGFARQVGSFVDPDPFWATRTDDRADSGIAIDVANSEVWFMTGVGHGQNQHTGKTIFSMKTGKFTIDPSMPWDKMVSTNLDYTLGMWISDKVPAVSHSHDTQVTRGKDLYLFQRYCQIDNVPAPVPPNVIIKQPTGKICWYNTDTKVWSFSQHQTRWPIGGSAVLDPVSQCIYIFNRDANYYQNIFKFDPVADTLTNGNTTTRWGFGDNSQPCSGDYCSDDDKFYMFQNNSAVARITIDRANFLNSRGERLVTTGAKPPVMTATGTPTGRPRNYPSMTWNPDTKTFVGWIVQGKHYQFNPATLTWTETAIQIEAGSEGGALPSHNFSHSTYDPGTKCVFFLEVAEPGGPRAWVYKLPATGGGGGGGADADADFLARSTAPGVVRSFHFNDASQLGGGYGDNFGTYTDNAGVRPMLDPTVKASGASSLLVEVRPMSGPDGGGLWFANFSADLGTRFGPGEEFYAQWRQRFSREMMETLFLNEDGQGLAPKQLIIGPGDTANPEVWWNSCEAIHLVVQSYYQFRVPIVYNSCTGSTSHPPYEGMYEKMPDGDHLLQNEVLCKRRSITSGGPDCVHWAEEEWMTFQMGVTVGPRVNDEFMDSRTRLWIARERQPSVLVLDWKPGVPGYWPLAGGPPSEDQQFGKIWLTAYMTGKVPNAAHPLCKTWYDELIISTQRIADPK